MKRPSEGYKGLAPSPSSRPDHPIRDALIAAFEYIGQGWTIFNAVGTGLGDSPDTIRAGFVLIFYSTILLCVEDACSLYDDGATKKNSSKLLRYAFIGTFATAFINALILCLFVFLTLPNRLMYVLGYFLFFCVMIAPLSYIVYLAVNIFE